MNTRIPNLGETYLLTIVSPLSDGNNECEEFPPLIECLNEVNPSVLFIFFVIIASSLFLFNLKRSSFLFHFLVLVLF